MSDQTPESSTAPDPSNGGAETPQDGEDVLIVGPNGQILGRGVATTDENGEAQIIPATDGQPADRAGEAQSDERHITELVEQPAKVMRIGSMIKQLLEEVKAAPLDEASRVRLKEIHQSSVKELEAGLAPELVEELERLSLPFSEDTPSEGELRIAQAQLVGWLEGLFHGIQTAIYAQQMSARAQLEQIRRALPPGMAEAMGQGVDGTPPGAQAGQPGQPGSHLGGEQSDDSGTTGGMYL